MLGIFELSILEEYLCVDIIKMMRGDLDTAIRICGGIENDEIVDIGELYEKSNRFELTCVGIVEAKNKEIFEKVLEIIVKNEEWAILELREGVNGYVWKVVIIKGRTIEEIMELIGGEKHEVKGL